MTFKLQSLVLALIAIAGMATGPVSFAQEVAVGDAKRGEKLGYTCLGCHGIPNYKNVMPMYHVPKLHGQSAAYLTVALKAYKSGERSHATMHAHAVSMNDRDMLDIATFLAGEPVNTAAVKTKGTAPKAAAVCVACHGTNGVGITPDYPILAGQHRDYLVQTLNDYKKGGRKNAVMVGFMGALTDADIQALAVFYAAQQPGLGTVKRRMTFMSSN